MPGAARVVFQLTHNEPWKSLSRLSCDFRPRIIGRGFSNLYELIQKLTEEMPWMKYRIRREF
jgi:hypothetical protein